jgi:hypothetical protein
VTGLVRTGIHRQPTVIVLTFAAPLDPTRAQNVDSYQIETLGGPGRGGSRVGHVIGVTAAVYDPATLFPTERLDIHNQYRLLVNGTAPFGLTGATGVPLDGKGDGKPGSDFEATISMSSLEGPAPPHVHSTFRAARSRWGDRSRFIEGVVAQAVDVLAVPAVCTRNCHLSSTARGGRPRGAEAGQRRPLLQVK